LGEKKKPKIIDHIYLKNHQSYFEKLSKKLEKMTSLTVKKEFSKNIKSLQFLMVKGSLSPNIAILDPKV
jgi:hypothetical protein